MVMYLILLSFIEYIPEDPFSSFNLTTAVLMICKPY